MALKIVFAKHDAVGRHLIASAIRNAGLEVTEVADSASIKDFNYSDFDLLVYDQDLNPAERISLAVWARHSSIPIIVVTNSRLRADRVLFSGKVVFVQESATDLIEAIKAVLGRIARKRIGSDTWHICVNCQDWPTHSYEKQWTLEPTDLELCNECRVKYIQKRCATSHVPG